MEQKEVGIRERGIASFLQRPDGSLAIIKDYDLINAVDSACAGDLASKSGLLIVSERTALVSEINIQNLAMRLSCTKLLHVMVRRSLSSGDFFSL